MKHFEGFNFRGKEATARLEALLAAVKPGNLSYELARHPHKGDAIGLLSELAHRLDPACELMVLAFPDSQRSVAALIDCLARQTQWADFERVLEWARGFSAQRPVWQRESRLLFESALSSSGGMVTLPLRQKLPPTVTPSGLGALVRGWFAPKTRVAEPRPAEMSQPEFRARYLAQPVAVVEPPAGPSPVRTRQQRIDEVMVSGELSADLFRMLTSREDGFTNLKRLIQSRPQALLGLRNPEFGKDLTLEQFYELWPLLSGSSLDHFGPKLMGNVRLLLSREQLVELCDSPSPRVVSAAVGDLSLRFAGGVRQDGKLEARIGQRQPGLRQSLREHFLSVVPPSPQELPRFGQSVAGAGPVSLLLTPAQLVVSTPGRLEWFCVRTGQSLFAHSGPDLPRLLYPLGPRRYLGQHGPLVSVVEASLGKLSIQNSRSSFELVSRMLVSYTDQLVYLHVYDEYDSGQDFTFDPSTGHIRSGKDLGGDHAQGATLDSLWQTHGRTSYPNGSELQICYDSFRKRYLAWPRRPEAGPMQTVFLDEQLACGLESYPGGHSWYCWRSGEEPSERAGRQAP